MLLYDCLWEFPEMLFDFCPCLSHPVVSPSYFNFLLSFFMFFLLLLLTVCVSSSDEDEKGESSCCFCWSTLSPWSLNYGLFHLDSSLFHAFLCFQLVKEQRSFLFFYTICYCICMFFGRVAQQYKCKSKGCPVTSCQACKTQVNSFFFALPPVCLSLWKMRMPLKLPFEFAQCFCKEIGNYTSVQKHPISLVVPWVMNGGVGSDAACSDFVSHRWMLYVRIVHLCRRQAPVWATSVSAACMHVCKKAA